MRPALPIAIAALVLAGGAAAKGPASAQVCGGSGCRLGDPELLNPVDGQPFVLASAPRPAPYYVAFLSSSGAHGFCWQIIWVPRRQVLRIENLRPYIPGGAVAGRYWRTVHAALAARLTRAVRGVTPYRAASSWRVPRARCTR